MTIIDSHNHVGTIRKARQSGGDLVAKMDKAGVERAVMFPFVEGDFTNDEIRVAHKEFPDRLIPYCAVNPWNAGALDELRRCIETDGFKGLKLHPTINGYHLSDPLLCDPLFEACGEYGIPIVVHGASDLRNCPPEFALMAARFPNVTLIMAHMGFFWSVDQAIRFANEYPNLYLETSRVPIFEIQKAVSEVGADKVIWGTDSPFVDYKLEFEKMSGAAEDRAAYEKIVGGNIARILKL
ncbi:amidohydrolase family protein [Jiella sonneratiae]|uniref:Amidohydrolase n=1 Tax=Jiella sonneratiae TaxID=2816856 RepID=A0ABS3J6K6_9HYPH|nr:amidohydrolase family protein [Jiella sonneratiae]MBO0904226.1 amidohydrolase [Jiella sonneratiae]